MRPSGLIPMVRLLSRVLPGKVKQTLAVTRSQAGSHEIEPYTMAIDLTSACNLRCTHCYVYRHEEVPYAMNQLPQLSDDEWLARIAQLLKTHPYCYHATWVGGEPLLRTSLLRRGTNYFPLNWVITNGTVPIPSDLRQTTFWVSLDGTERIHDAIRGAGTYQQARGHIAQTAARVYIHSVINRLNQHGLESLMTEWQGTHVRGIKFSLYTPARGVEDPLWLPPEERDRVVERLRALKPRYGAFLVMTTAELDALCAVNQDVVYGANCLLRRGMNLALNPQGEAKRPCVMGERSDCTRCGCVMPAMSYASNVRKDVATAWSMFRTFL